MSQLPLPMLPRFRHLVYARYTRSLFASLKVIWYRHPLGCLTLFLLGEIASPPSEAITPLLQGRAALTPSSKYISCWKYIYRCLSSPCSLVNSRASGAHPRRKIHQNTLVNSCHLVPFSLPYAAIPFGHICIGAAAPIRSGYSLRSLTDC